MNRTDCHTSTNLDDLPAAMWHALIDAAHGSGPPVEHPLYSPLLATHAQRPLVYAHLAQSLDGRIALEDGESQWISGSSDLDHTHRLRALADAVMVGAHTVTADNPRLTVRRVPGPSPQRVVLDPSLRLNPNHLIFQDDGAWRICQSDAPGEGGLRLPSEASGMDPAGILSILHDRGIRRLFIEGGAVTISRFLAAGCIDRLHLVVSPVVLGSGRSSIQLAPLASLSEARRPEVKVFPLGQDTLFDCMFRN